MQNNAPGSVQDKFENFGAAPTEPLWDSIAAKLDEDKKRRAPFWWWFLGSAAVIAIVFGVYQLGYNAGVTEKDFAFSESNVDKNLQISDGEKNNSVNHNQELNQTAEKNIAPNKNQEVNQTGENKITSNSSSNFISNSTNLNSEVEEKKQVNNQEEHSIFEFMETSNFKGGNIMPIDQFVIKQVEDYMAADAMVNDDIKKLPIQEICKIDYSDELSEFNLEPLVQIEKPKKEHHWEIGFNIGTLKGRNSSGQNLMPDPNASLTTADNLSQENTISGTGLQSYSNLSESQVNVSRPFQTEITLTRSLGKRWNFQTGLGLGFLFSKNVYASTDGMNVRSKFLSVAVPVHFNYDLIQRRRFAMYTGLGVNYEVPLFESVKTSYANSAFESVSTKNFTVGYMISGQFNTGFRFIVNEKLKLDFRPNMRYYIHQSMKGTYPALERKFWAGASVGLLWSL